MKLNEEMEEKLVLIIQAVLGVLIIALSVRNSAKMQSDKMKKVLDTDAKQIGRLHKKEYKLQKKLMSRKYKNKLKSLKTKQGKQSKNTENGVLAFFCNYLRLIGDYDKIKSSWKILQFYKQ